MNAKGPDSTPPSATPRSLPLGEPQAGTIASRFDATTRLATRVFNGEVVFFVGSGFSIDSEGNSAVRLVGRLLAGLLAMDTVLAEETENTPSDASVVPAERRWRRRGEEGTTLAGLRQVFGLSGAFWRQGAPLEPARCMTETNIKLLAREYYNFNEWSVSTLSVLSAELIELEESRLAEVAVRIERLGTFLLGLVGDSVPLDPIDWRALRAFASDAARGKALFLDIMGFANEDVMAGRPYDPNIEVVSRSYRDRLLLRHHAIARLAREGVAPAIVTTNYDLLLEGAYRLAGFLDRETTGEPDNLPLANVPRFSSIAGADQFFARGEGHRTALLLKIHGSAEIYRQVRQERLESLKKDPTSTSEGQRSDRWASYLPAIVFTYREIQTWRADAWSRDLIRTMLRTHTLALCGYSGADPIMHATFREVYEERAAAGARVPVNTHQDAGNAPVFSFGIAARREFHSLEILRAATAAAGYRTGKLVEHPNLIEFERANGFPTIDDHFRLVVHCVVRDLQLQALTTRLRRITLRLLGHPCPDADFTALLEHFEVLRKAERTEIASAGNRHGDVPAGERRRRFESVVDWTWHFVPGMLRELALAEFVESRQGPGSVVRTHRLFPWYQAASERLEWTAWAAIVELALRSMVATCRNSSNGVAPGSDSSISAEGSPHAAISFSCSAQEWQPQALCIRLAGFERPGRPPKLTGAFRHVAYWEFNESDVPWPLEPTGLCPSATVLWNCAAGRPVDAAAAARHLGVTT